MALVEGWDRANKITKMPPVMANKSAAKARWTQHSRTSFVATYQRHGTTSDLPLYSVTTAAGRSNESADHSQSNDLAARRGQKKPAKAETLRMRAEIGRQIRTMYDEVIGEGVPSRFSDLLQRLDSNGNGSTA